MTNGLNNILTILGAPASSGITEKEIKDSLWYYYFDEEKATGYLVDQQSKKAEKKEKGEQQPLPVLQSGGPDLEMQGGEGAAGQQEGSKAGGGATGMNGDCDMALAEETQRALVIDGPSTPTPAVQGMPTKPSLATMAASSKNSKPSLAAFARPPQSGTSANGSTRGGLSKLAARAQAQSKGTMATKPPSSLARLASKSQTTLPAAKDQSMTVEGLQSAASQPSKLSKLQQRIQQGPRAAMPSTPGTSQTVETEIPTPVEPPFALPTSSLFSFTPTPQFVSSPHPSGFAHVLAPWSQGAADADAEKRVTDLAAQQYSESAGKAFEAPSPDDLIVQQKGLAPVASAAPVATRALPVRR